MATVIIDVTIDGIEYRIPDHDDMSQRLQEIKETLQDQAIFFKVNIAERHTVYLVWNEDKGGIVTRYCDKIPTEELDSIWENHGDASQDDFEE